MNTLSLLRGAPNGEVTTDGDRIQVVFHRRYAKPIAKVWAALTVPERLADWFGAAEVDLRQGGSLTLNFENGASMGLGIVRVDPPRLLEWSWQLGGLDTSVLFELAPDGDGCRLTLTHSGVPARGPSAGVRAGWHAHLEGLADSLDGKVTPWSVKEQREREVGPLYPSMPG